MSLWNGRPEKQLVLSWVNRAQPILVQFSKLLQPFFALPSPVTVETGSVLAHLSKQCSLTSDSVLALVALGKMWDGEMLVRSVVEGTLRFAYICAGDPVEREQRRAEYSELLPEIAELKHSFRAARLLEVIAAGESRHRRPIQELVLLPERVEELRRKYPTKDSKQLEHKWSFHSLVDAFTRSDLPAAESASALFHNYGISSHLIHQDGTAMHLICDRENREADRRTAIDVAHAARELSDVIEMGALRALVALRIRHLDLRPFRKRYESLHELRSEFHATYQRWESIEYRDDKCDRAAEPPTGSWGGTTHDS